MESLDGPGVHFKQTADIDMSGQSWTPFDFDGHFDGNGQKISHVKIDQPNSDNIGFFSKLLTDGELKNVHLENVEVKGKGSVGGLVGMSDGSITNSYVTGSVTGTEGDVGGLVGESNGNIANSYATGSVTGYSNVGGLVGDSNGSVANSYATGSVTGYSDVGGLVGDLRESITNSYATGSVTGYSGVGGLVGESGGRIANSYATGCVTGTIEVGGLVGQSGGGSITSSYYDKETTRQSDNDGRGIPLTTAEMKKGTPSLSIYDGWDINIWDFGTTGEYPTLWISTPVIKPITAITAITGTPQVGQTLTAGDVTPAGATVTYQWQIETTAGGPYADIAGAISDTYTPVAADASKSIRVVVTGTGSYSGTTTSVATTAITSQ